MKAQARVKRLIKDGSYLLTHPALLRRDKQFSFVISHMRSRSTVLSHVLGSSRQIAGYTEMRWSYPFERSLTKLTVDLHRREPDAPKPRYCFDKILHDNCRVAPSLFEKPIKFLFLLCEPVPTIRSIVKLYQQRDESDQYAHLYNTPKMARRYYVGRLNTMVNYAHQLQPGTGFLLQSETLVNDTQSVLDQINEWLGFSGRDALTPECEVKEHTGQKGHGDSSEHIRAGRVVATRSDDSIELTQTQQTVAVEAYERCLGQLRAQCYKRSS